jgi:hypothetical protein
MARPDGTVSRELRSAACGGDETTPLRLVMLVGLVIAGAVSLVTCAVLLIYYLG